MSSRAAAPLVVMEAIREFSLFNHATANYQALGPVEIGLHEVDSAELVQEFIASAFGDFRGDNTFPSFPRVAVGKGLVKLIDNDADDQSRFVR